MSSFWLPESVYRALPATYGITGVALLVAFRSNAFAVASALLLIGAGLLVSLWRFRHRTVVSSSTAAREAFYRRKRRESSVTMTHV